MSVYRCFVEKKPAFAVEAGSVKKDLETALLREVEGVRVLNRYDIENIDREDYENAKNNQNRGDKEEKGFRYSV